MVPHTGTPNTLSNSKRLYGSSGLITLKVIDYENIIITGIIFSLCL